PSTKASSCQARKRRRKNGRRITSAAAAGSAHPPTTTAPNYAPANSPRSRRYLARARRQGAESNRLGGHRFARRRRELEVPEAVEETFADPLPIGMSRTGVHNPVEQH